MSTEREDNKALADRLRGKAVEVGKQAAQQIGKMQTVSEISGPGVTPKVGQDQNAQARGRQVAEKQEQQPVKAPGQATPAKTVEAVGKGNDMAAIARGLREQGVTGRTANDVSPAKYTPQVEQKQSRGRGR